MTDKKKETKKLLMVDEEAQALRSEGATSALVFSFVSFMSLAAGLAGGHCFATPWCSNGFTGLAKAFIAPQTGGAVVASGPNFAPTLRPAPALTAASTAAASTAVAAAKPPPDARDVYEQAQRKLLEVVFDPKRWRPAIRLGEPTSQRNDDGTYDVQVPVSWSIEPAPILERLNAYFSDVNGYPLRAERVDFSGRMTPNTQGVVISRPFNRGEAQKLPYTERLYDWLCRQQLQAVISIGAIESRLTLATGRDCFVTCDGHGNRLFQLHLEHTAGAAGLIFSSKQGEHEPIVLRGVPDTAIGEPVEVRVERREPPLRPPASARSKTIQR